MCVLEYTAKRTCKEMTRILKEHRDWKLESARKIRSKNPLELQQGTAQEREKERTERKRMVCAVTKQQTYY